jgi:Hsp20/alpha crystallin family protein
LTIQGERKREHEQEKGGVYRSERRYGSFCRSITLPEGAMTDQAKATFKDGVLEIAMPAAGVGEAGSAASLDLLLVAPRASRVLEVPSASLCRQPSLSHGFARFSHPPLL